jgi:gluconate 2-dehydrogenase gamma chain
VKLDRRDVLKLAAGAALARPALVDAVAAASLPAGRFFEGRELALLDALSETILPADDHSPGARAAGVAAFVDAQLAEKDPKIPEWAEERAAARKHLAALDALSREITGKGFLEASGEERIAVLTAAAANEKEPRTPAEAAFKWAKEETAEAYYSSKIGIHQEMEYKGNSLQVEFAGDEPK